MARDRVRHESRRGSVVSDPEPGSLSQRHPLSVLALELRPHGFGDRLRVAPVLAASDLAAVPPAPERESGAAAPLRAQRRHVHAPQRDLVQVGEHRCSAHRRAPLLRVPSRRRSSRACRSSSASASTRRSAWRPTARSRRATRTRTHSCPHSTTPATCACSTSGSAATRSSRRTSSRVRNRRSTPPTRTFGRARSSR